MRKSWWLLFLNLSYFYSTAQTVDVKHYIIPELQLGSIVPNFLNYPSTNPRIGLTATFYTKKIGVDDPVQRYYKSPLTGIQIGFHRLGNPAIFGNEIDLVPVLNLPTRKGSFQFGLGLAYFTKTYKSNNENQVIGSSFTWSFQAMYYRNFHFNSQKNLRVGIGYLHGSNGHTQLPNYGINSAVLSMSVVPKSMSEAYNFSETQSSLKNKCFINLKSGIGYHEFGGTTKPVNGPKKAVYSTAIKAGIQFNGQFRWYAGFGARKYQHYADSIASSPILESKNVSAYNIYFVTGIEYLVYHIGINIDGGINLYKPFYPHFAKRYETTGNWQYFTKKNFISRVGIKLYLKNTAKNPKHNFYIAPYLNANFGQADFSEIEIGYTARISS